MYNLVNLKDRRILITGAASGIGRQIAVTASRLGGKIVILDINSEGMEETISMLEGEDHGYFPLDLSDLNNIEKNLAIISENYAPFDGFVHSAGISITRPLTMTTPEIIKKSMDINFGSFVEITRFIVKGKFYKHGMSIVAISSISSVQGNQSKTVYCASKAALDGAMRCMAKELAPRHIRVNSIMPGLTRTPIFEAFLRNSGDSEDAKSIVSRQYLGLGEPLDIANMAAYLLSDAARFITGSAIPVDGGRLSS
jgi:NAD(P)-dependent dehydrogenase (short-subunit alcohol dehydrogenase family)